AVLAVVVYVLGRNLDSANELLLLANVATITLLAGYHRFYDAALLALPMAWAAGRLTSRDDSSRVDAVIAAGCCVVFFVSGGWALQKLAEDGRFAAVSGTYLWDAVALRHQTWALVLLEAVLVGAVARAAGLRKGPVSTPLGNARMRTKASLD